MKILLKVYLSSDIVARSLIRRQHSNGKGNPVYMLKKYRIFRVPKSLSQVWTYIPGEWPWCQLAQQSRHLCWNRTSPTCELAFGPSSVLRCWESVTGPSSVGFSKASEKKSNEFQSEWVLLVSLQRSYWTGFTCHHFTPSNLSGPLLKSVGICQRFTCQMIRRFFTGRRFFFSETKWAICSISSLCE